MNLPSAGYLSDSNSLLYRVPAGKLTEITLINLQNEDTVERTLNLYIKILNTNFSVRILPSNMPITIEDGIHYNTLIIIQDNCEIWGSANVANKVSYLITGKEY